MNKDKNVPLALLTGGTGHIGSAITKALKECGWHVAVLSSTRSSDDIYKCNIADRESVATVVDTIVHMSGKIDACIHAAAARMSKAKSESDEQMSVTLMGAENLASAALPHMKKG